MGANRWRSLTAWPQENYQTWKLVSSGLTSISQLEGLLATVDPTVPPNKEGDDISAITGAVTVDTVVHDPWRPVPSLGGHAAIPSGSFDRSALDCRSDVLTYTSSSLDQPLQIAGHIEAIVHCQSDRPSFDLCCTVSEVFPNGSIYPLTQGYGRFTAQPNSWATHRLTLQPTCFCITAGNALRLSISAACYPAYALNIGTGGSPASSRLLEAKVITLMIQVGQQSDTSLLLPIAGCE